MNKIKQTEKSLQALNNLLHPSVSVSLSESTEELIQKTDKLLNKSKERQKPLSQQPIFKYSAQVVHQQLQARDADFKMKVKHLEEELRQPRSGNVVRMQLVNSVMWRKPIDYNNCFLDRIVYSVSNRVQYAHRGISKKSSQLAMKKNGMLMDENQQAIFDIFNTKEQIHFIFKNEMDLNIKVIKYSRNGQYREDKDIYEANLIENQIYEEQNDRKQTIQKQLTTQQYQFEFLNIVSYYTLWRNTNVPRVLRRQYHIYQIFREIILDSLDYLHTKEIGHGIVYKHDKVGSMFNDSEALPSSFYNKDIDYRLYSQPHSDDSDINSENKIRQIEKKIRTTSPRIRKHQKKGDGESPIEHLLYRGVDVLKDYKIIQIQQNNSQQALAIIKQHHKDTTNLKIPANLPTTKGVLEKSLRGDHFFKKKGNKDEYHVCWMEMRGFYLLWYHNNKDKVARGIGLIDDVMIKDDGLIDDMRLYHVKLLDRQLTFRLDKPVIGLIWRKLIANQIAYKTYLNNLWFNCKVQDKSPKILKHIIEYFFNENAQTMQLSNDTLQLAIPQAYINLDYSVQIGSILFDTILYHTRIKEINLRNSRIGPVAITTLLRILQEKRVHNKITLLDLSDCHLNYECADQLAQYLMNDNSFNLNQLYLDNNELYIGNLRVICDALQARYLQYWESKEPIKRKLKESERNDLALIRVLSVQNVQTNDLDCVFQFIEVMMGKAMQFLDEPLPKVEDTILMHNGPEVLESMIKKLSRRDAIFSRHTLKLIRELCYYQEFKQQEVMNLIRMDLDISNNPILKIDKLANLVQQYDCFKSLTLQALQYVESDQFTQFANQLGIYMCIIRQFTEFGVIGYATKQVGYWLDWVGVGWIEQQLFSDNVKHYSLVGLVVVLQL